MPRNFGLKLQNSPKLPHIHARIYCDANEQSSLQKGLFTVVTGLSGAQFLYHMSDFMQQDKMTRFLIPVPDSQFCILYLSYFSIPKIQ